MTTMTTYTEEQLNAFTDAQVLEVFMPRMDEFEIAQGYWVHSENLWIGVYDEVIADNMTDEEKSAWVVEFMDRFGDEITEDTFDAIMEENDWLAEDIGCDDWDKPKYKDASVIFLFRFMMDNDFYTEAFVNFLNGVEAY